MGKAISHRGGPVRTVGNTRTSVTKTKMAGPAVTKRGVRTSAPTQSGSGSASSAGASVSRGVRGSARNARSPI